METIYDWVTVSIFAGLVVLFLQRSVGAETEREGDSLLLYLAAGAGCAGANYFGNDGHDLLAVALLVFTVGFILHFLEPFRSSHR